MITKDTAKARGLPNWGSSRFKFNQDTVRKVGFFDLNWTGPDFYELEQAYSKLCEFDAKRNIWRVELNSKRSLEKQSDKPILIRERDENAAKERATKLLKDAKEAKAAAIKAMERNQNVRDSLTMKSLNPPSDFASVTIRERMRRTLDGMGEADVLKAMRTADLPLLTAMLEVGPEYTVLTENQYQAALDRAQLLEHGEALEHIANVEQAAETTLKAADAAVHLAKEQFVDELYALPVDEANGMFDSLVESV